MFPVLLECQWLPIPVSEAEALGLYFVCLSVLQNVFLKSSLVCERKSSPFTPLTLLLMMQKHIHFKWKNRKRKRPNGMKEGRENESTGIQVNAKFMSFQVNSRILELDGENVGINNRKGF